MEQDRYSGELAHPTCRQCGESKPQDAFERLPSGGRRGTCKDCRAATAMVWKRDQRAYEQRGKAYERAAETKARKDAIWAPMYAERARRAQTAVLPEPKGIHRLALDGGGYISIVEFAARVAERQRVMKSLRRGLVEIVVPQDEPERELWGPEELQAA